MNIKATLRSLLLDWLAARDDRYYWRQPSTHFQPAQGATFCLWQPDGKLGDSVIHTTFIHTLATQRPDMRIVIVCAPSLVGFWQRIPGVAMVVGASDSAQAIAAVKAARLSLDVFMSMEAFLSIDTARFIRATKPRNCIGLNVGRYRAFTHSISDNTYDHPRRHVTERMRNLCELIQVPYVDASGLPSVALSGRTDRVSLADGTQHIFLNVYGAGPQKAFTDETVTWLIQELRTLLPGAHIVLNVPANQRDRFAAYCGPSDGPRVSLAPENMDLWELIALMAQCAAVVTPDTGIGHIAAALRQPLTVFFEDAHYTPVVWSPNTPTLEAVLPVTNGNVNLFDRKRGRTQVADMCAQLTPGLATPVAYT